MTSGLGFCVARTDAFASKLAPTGISCIHGSMWERACSRRQRLGVTSVRICRKDAQMAAGGDALHARARPSAHNRKRV
ncbi:hypothetical protein C3E97_001795 [Pseudomonas sp. MWU12-2115]|nr:hypothetical protein C3E97_001795 [Pseudomonas sp. MWU12-2115]